ncbi:MAG: ribonuclease H-like domain-containing protein [Bacteroidales bacterium]|nr:ribonuclease H-like domain-containing protein [Bacteroidales bacterium]
MNELSEKLKALGVKLGAEHIQSKPIKLDYKGNLLSDCVNGRRFSSGKGEVFIVEKAYSLDYIHGNIPLIIRNLPRILINWAKLDENKPYKRLLFMDTETSGLMRGTGTLVFMVGMGYFENNLFHSVQVFLEDPSQELAYLDYLNEFMGRFDTFVTFNGKSFDVPVLNSRFSIHNLPFIGKEMQHIDLLALARKVWKLRLASRTLKSLETNILDFHRSEEEVPGWMVPEIYFNYLLSGDVEEMSGVFYHNEIDIVSLGALLYHLSNIIESPLICEELSGLDLISIAMLYEGQGLINNALELYDFSVSQDLPVEIYTKTLLRFAKIYKKQKKWTNAIELWEKIAYDIEACIELAKYYEHQTKQYHSSLKWTNLAINILEKSKISINIKLNKEEIIHRKNRIISKIEKEKQ